MTPALAACCSIAAPEAASRSVIMRTFTPDASICWAMVFIFGAEPSAFWMSQLRLYFVQLAFSAAGSAVTQRGEDVVSGRMMPTLVPLPSMPPPAAAGVEAGAAGVDAPAGVLAPAALLLPPLLLELQADR